MTAAHRLEMAGLTHLWIRAERTRSIDFADRILETVSHHGLTGTPVRSVHRCARRMPRSELNAEVVTTMPLRARCPCSVRLDSGLAVRFALLDQHSDEMRRPQRRSALTRRT